MGIFVVVMDTIRHMETTVLWPCGNTTSGGAAGNGIW